MKYKTLADLFEDPARWTQNDIAKDARDFPLIRFCNAFNATVIHASTCEHCDAYLRFGDGQMCDTGKDIIAMEMFGTDTTTIELCRDSP